MSTDDPSVAIKILIPQSLRARIKDFRHAQKIDTEAEAIRRLLEDGLSASDKLQAIGGAFQTGRSG